MRGWRADKLADFAQFARLVIETGDVDPVYPVLAALRHRLDEGEMAWLSLLHVAYYDLGSATLAFEHFGAPDRTSFPRQLDIDHLKLPCATERRAHRDPAKLREHLMDLAQHARLSGGLLGTLRWWATQGPRPMDYRTFFLNIQQVYGNGRWAAYKTSELLSYTLAPYSRAWARLRPTDMGHAYSSGPRHGLAVLYEGALPEGNSADAVRRLDDLSNDLVAWLLGEGVSATTANTETALCDFHSMVQGRYYVGHDIDQLCSQLDRARRWLAGRGNVLQPGSVLAHLVRATSMSFPIGYVWNEQSASERLFRKRLYARTGKIVERSLYEVEEHA